jgi:hypothetical protein
MNQPGQLTSGKLYPKPKTDEVSAMNKKIYVLLAFCVLISGCASFTRCEKTSTSGTGQPPVIIDSYAPSKIRPGATWRVYLRAQDPDGDMKETIQALVKGRNGFFKTSFVPLRAEHSAEMGGYFFLRTPSPAQADYSRLVSVGLTLRMTINDCQGNKSEQVEFPVNFTYEESRDLPPEWKDVANNSLGAIMFDLGDMLRKKQRE